MGDRILRGFLFLFLLCVHGTGLLAQDSCTKFVAPFDFPLLLSGNFAELRSNHFHSGVDFKTEGVVGKPIKCVADGYICRATVRSGGYGLALYVMHDNGYMTVYGHLDAFPSDIARRVREYQYENETFSVDMTFAPDEYRLCSGDFLAYAGNTGYSFGPHLHFEVRDTTGNILYDPMPFYRNLLTDTRAPEISSLAVYPKTGQGCVGGDVKSVVYDLTSTVLKDTISAWGKISFGIKALDFMDNTTNKYGVYNIELLVDGVKCFSSTMDKFSFAEDRVINAWLDYDRCINENLWFQRLHVLDNNRLGQLWANDERGWVNIDEERIYEIECILSDYHGNTNKYRFFVKGECDKVEYEVDYTHRLFWSVNNRVEYMGMRLDVPANELFENALLDVSVSSGEGVSWRYNFGNRQYPLWHGGKISIWVGDMSNEDASKLYIRRVTEKGYSAVGGKYQAGRITANIDVIGSYEVAMDTVPPQLTFMNETKWNRAGRMVFTVADETYMSSFKGTLDGEFVLFSHNSKNSTLILDCKSENIARGKHWLSLVVTDACGNETVFEKEFEY